MAIRKKFTWKRTEKLKSRKLIERIFREGKSFTVFPFRVHYIVSRPLTVPPACPPSFPMSLAHSGPPPILPLQAGFGATTRNFKKATDRNRIKRLSREAWRLHKQPLADHLQQNGHSVSVFFIYTGKELPDYNTVTEKISVALQRLIKETGK